MLVWCGVLVGCGASGVGTDTSSASTTSNTTQEAAQIDGATAVDTTSDFAYDFSAAIDTSTVDATTFFLAPNDDSADTSTANIATKKSLPEKSSDSSCNASRAIAATVECPSAQRCVLHPAAELAFEGMYHICITASIRYRDGGNVAATRVTFTTAPASDTALSDYAGDSSNFSDETYTQMSSATLATDLFPRDPTTAQTAIDQYDALPAPDTMQSQLITFDTCPDNSNVTGVDARQILVPEQYLTIQKAIDVAKNYQTIVVNASKTFKENLHIQGKYVNLVSSSDTQQVDLQAAKSGLPVITVDCGGGVLLRSFSLHGGSAGVKADTSTKGIQTILTSTISDVGAGIIIHGGEVVISKNTITANYDAIMLSKTKGQIHANTLSAGSIAVYLTHPVGMKIWLNTFQEILIGALFIDGGVAAIVENTFSMMGSGFGIFAQYTTSALGVLLKIESNTITQAQGFGMLVLGKGGETTSAIVEGNSVQNTASAVDVNIFDWLDYTYSDHNINAFRSGMGLLVIDAKANTFDNNFQSNAHSGMNFQRSCGSVMGNTSQKNVFGLVTLINDDTDGCSTVTYSGNTITNNSQQNIYDSNGATLSVPAPPKLVEMPGK